MRANEQIFLHRSLYISLCPVHTGLVAQVPKWSLHTSPYLPVFAQVSGHKSFFTGHRAQVSAHSPLTHVPIPIHKSLLRPPYISPFAQMFVSVHTGPLAQVPVHRSLYTGSCAQVPAHRVSYTGLRAQVP